MDEDITSFHLSVQQTEAETGIFDGIHLKGTWKGTLSIYTNEWL